MKTFKRYLLEGIKPSQTSYGLDLSNKEWLALEITKPRFLKGNKVEDFFYSTYFKSDGKFYGIIFTRAFGKVEVAFESSEKFDAQLFTSGDEERIFDFLENNFSFNLTNTRQAQTILNKVFYVILEGCDKFGIKSFSFKAAGQADSKLSAFYEKFFLKDGNVVNLEKNRLVFTGKKDQVFLFKIK